MLSGSVSATLRSDEWNDWSRNPDAYELMDEGQLLRLTLRNTTSVDQTYSLDVVAITTAIEAATPVPEPASIGLMAAGLLVLARVRRNRRQAA